MATACGFPRPADVGEPMSDASPDAALPGQSIRSCQALPATCGAAGQDSCCTTLTVPSGSFYRRYDEAADAYSGTRDYPATVSSFRLDKYEVTVGRFRAFVTAGEGTTQRPPMTGSGEHPAIPGTGWDEAWNPSLNTNTGDLIVALRCAAGAQTWTDTAGPDDVLPINCVSWFEARAFCAWDGGVLPTATEWNYAAVGGDQHRAYPWSHPPASLTLDDTRAIYSAGPGGPARPQAVGSRPAGDGRWEQSDLAGNVAEWTLDWQGALPIPASTRRAPRRGSAPAVATRTARSTSAPR